MICRRIRTLDAVVGYMEMAELFCNSIPLMVLMAGPMALRHNKQFLHCLKDDGAFGPFLPALPTPLCDCGIPAFVKQSKHSKSASRAFYTCQLKRAPNLMPI